MRPRTPCSAIVQQPGALLSTRSCCTARSPATRAVAAPRRVHGADWEAREVVPSELCDVCHPTLVPARDSRTRPASAWILPPAQRRDLPVQRLGQHRVPETEVIGMRGTVHHASQSIVGLVEQRPATSRSSPASRVSTSRGKSRPSTDAELEDLPGTARRKQRHAAEHRLAHVAGEIESRSSSTAPPNTPSALEKSLPPLRCRAGCRR